MSQAQALAAILAKQGNLFHVFCPCDRADGFFKAGLAIGTNAAKNLCENALGILAASFGQRSQEAGRPCPWPLFRFAEGSIQKAPKMLKRSDGRFVGSSGLIITEDGLHLDE